LLKSQWKKAMSITGKGTDSSPKLHLKPAFGDAWIVMDLQAVLNGTQKKPLQKACSRISDAWHRHRL
jgi:hypothetical protein